MFRSRVSSSSPVKRMKIHPSSYHALILSLLHCPCLIVALLLVSFVSPWTHWVLFLYSLRVLLHKSCSAESNGGCHSPQATVDDQETSRSLIQSVIEQSLARLEEEPGVSERSIRWELGSCWVQHLQKQKTAAEGSSKDRKDENGTELTVKGLGKQFKLLKKREKKSTTSGTDVKEDNNSLLSNMNGGIDGGESNNESNSEAELKKLISEEEYLRLKETGTGLHLKVSKTLFSITNNFRLTKKYLLIKQGK